jgi:TatD family-associated radical SAM protein
LGSAQNLWLQKEPSAEEVIRELKKYGPTNFEEVVFCGYGEPFCAFPVMLKVCRYLKTLSVKVRINTNGLANLITKNFVREQNNFLFKTKLDKPVVSFLHGFADVISISLNASCPQKYLELCKPQFGISSFNEILKFAQECKVYVFSVVFSVVDIIGNDEIEECKKLARDLDIPLRVRHFSR